MERERNWCFTCLYVRVVGLHRLGCGYFKLSIWISLELIYNGISYSVCPLRAVDGLLLSRDTTNHPTILSFFVRLINRAAFQCFQRCFVLVISDFFLRSRARMLQNEMWTECHVHFNYMLQPDSTVYVQCIHPLLASSLSLSGSSFCYTPNTIATRVLFLCRPVCFIYDLIEQIAIIPCCVRRSFD